jgi:hypothetical protein
VACQGPEDWGGCGDLWQQVAHSKKYRKSSRVVQSLKEKKAARGDACEVFYFFKLDASSHKLEAA